MAWIIKLKIDLHNQDWYVTSVRRDKKNCSATTDRYHACVYRKPRNFNDLEFEHEIIEIPEDELHLYEHEKVDWKNLR